MDERLTVHLIDALTNIWSAIRRRHPEVPPVVLLPAPAQRGELRVLGHFAPLRWSARTKGEDTYHEVVVVAEHLDRSAEAIAETLLHEAAHALNFARGIKDCSRSQYHNSKFKAAAEELGLLVANVKHYGFAYTTLPIETVNVYEKEIRALEEVLVVHRRKPRVLQRIPPAAGGEGADDPSANTPQGRSRKATCACGFIIRVSMKTMRDTVIRCESCGGAFCLV